MIPLVSIMEFYVISSAILLHNFKQEAGNCDLLMYTEPRISIKHVNRQDKKKKSEGSDFKYLSNFDPDKLEIMRKS